MSLFPEFKVSISSDVPFDRNFVSDIVMSFVRMDWVQIESFKEVTICNRLQNDYGHDFEDFYKEMYEYEFTVSCERGRIPGFTKIILTYFEETYIGGNFEVVKIQDTPD